MNPPSWWKPHMTTATHQPHRRASTPSRRCRHRTRRHSSGGWLANRSGLDARDRGSASVGCSGDRPGGRAGSRHCHREAGSPRLRQLRRLPKKQKTNCGNTLDTNAALSARRFSHPLDDRSLTCNFVLRPESTLEACTTLRSPAPRMLQELGPPQTRAIPLNPLIRRLSPCPEM